MLRVTPLILVMLLMHPLRAADAPTSPAVFDRIKNAYHPHMDLNDPYAFPLKVRALNQSPSTFWRGGKDLFFEWCKDPTHTQIRNWLADKDSYFTQQGDPHLGNIGSYLTEGPFGALAFGMVDFDDSHRAPFQLELLQGLVTLRLAAREAQITLTDSRMDELATIVLDNYRRAVLSDQSATELVADDPRVKKLLAVVPKKEYAKELARYADDDEFVRVVATRKTDIKDILRPVDRPLTDSIAAALSQAIADDPALRAHFRVRDPRSIRESIEAVAIRTRPGSSGSQGLNKYFVLMEDSLLNVNANVILYLKQQIPTAPERVGLIPRDPRPPGLRAAHDYALLSTPKPFLNGSCTINGQSYWITIREPWTYELDPDDIKNLDDLKAHARLWAIATGSSHRHENTPDRITPRLTPKLTRQLIDLSFSYITRLEADYRAFTRDPRTIALTKSANDLLDKELRASPSSSKDDQ